MTTIETKNGLIEVTSEVLRDYSKLMRMMAANVNATDPCGDGITILNCIVNGQDTAVSEGVGRNKGERNYSLASIYFAVQTAKSFEFI